VNSPPVPILKVRRSVLKFFILKENPSVATRHLPVGGEKYDKKVDLFPPWGELKGGVI
jgi:hypothetical protein